MVEKLMLFGLTRQEATIYVSLYQNGAMNGYEAAKAIRASAHPEGKTIPIYAMTANTFTEDVSEAFHAGMNGHLEKPIDTALVYEILEKIVNEKKGEGTSEMGCKNFV